MKKAFLIFLLFSFNTYKYSLSPYIHSRAPYQTQKSIKFQKSKICNKILQEKMKTKSLFQFFQIFALKNPFLHGTYKTNIFDTWSVTKYNTTVVPLNSIITKTLDLEQPFHPYFYDLCSQVCRFISWIESDKQINQMSCLRTLLSHFTEG